MLEIAYSNAAARALARMPKADAARLMKRIAQFAAAPKGQFPWARPLSGRPETRLRQGDWRALVLADKAAGRLTVLDVGHRREIYR